MNRSLLIPLLVVTLTGAAEARPMSAMDKTVIAQMTRAKHVFGETCQQLVKQTGNTRTNSWARFPWANNNGAGG